MPIRRANLALSLLRTSRLLLLHHRLTLSLLCVSRLLLLLHHRLTLSLLKLYVGRFLLRRPRLLRLWSHLLLLLTLNPALLLHLLLLLHLRLPRGLLRSGRRLLLLTLNPALLLHLLLLRLRLMRGLL